MAKRTIFQAFNTEFEKNLSQTNSYQQAYQKAEQSFEEKIGCSVFSNYESFRVRRSQIRNRK